MLCETNTNVITILGHNIILKITNLYKNIDQTNLILCGKQNKIRKNRLKNKKFR
jgi:hypothetical protein